MSVVAAALMLLVPVAAVQERSVPAGTAIVFATIDQSEWCPAGNVQLDLTSGDYVVTAGASWQTCQDATLERPRKAGRLDASRLAGVRQAFRVAQAQGVDRCRDGRHPDGGVVSNGGPQILVLTNGARSIAAPDDLSCWTGAAWALNDELGRAFRASR